MTRFWHHQGTPLIYFCPYFHVFKTYFLSFVCFQQGVHKEINFTVGFPLGLFLFHQVVYIILSSCLLLFWFFLNRNRDTSLSAHHPCLQGVLFPLRSVHHPPDAWCLSVFIMSFSIPCSLIFNPVVSVADYLASTLSLIFYVMKFR